MSELPQPDDRPRPGRSARFGVNGTFGASSPAPCRPDDAIAPGANAGWSTIARGLRVAGRGGRSRAGRLAVAGVNKAGHPFRSPHASACCGGPFRRPAAEPGPAAELRP